MGCIWTLSFSSRFLDVPGANLQNVCILQTPEDSSKILELATGKNLVIIGASFIGSRLEGYQIVSDSLETHFWGLCRLTRGPWRRDAHSPPGWGPPQSPTAGGGVVLHSMHSLFPLLARNFESYKEFLDRDRGESAS